MNKVTAKLTIRYDYEDGYSELKQYESTQDLKMQNEKSLTDDSEVITNVIEEYLENPLHSYGNIESLIFSCIALSNEQKLNIIRSLLDFENDELLEKIKEIIN